MSDFDDYDVEDVLGDIPKKRKNSKAKGKRGELALCKMLNKRFPGHTFSRVVGSGNRWSHVAQVSKDYIGDVVCPPNFQFAIECKFGYPEIDLCSAFDGGEKLLDSFLEQAQEDGRRANKEPMLCWKKNRQPWLAFLRDKKIRRKSDYFMQYREWTVVPLSHLLSFQDGFFFLDGARLGAE